MADEKLNPGQKNNKPPEATVPPGASDLPVPEPIKSPGDPPGHEQAVIPGMVEDVPAPASKVIDLSGIKAAADHNGNGPIVPDVIAKPPETVPNQKRRGRPPKAKPEAGAGKQGKTAEPRTGRPSKVDKAAREEAPPAVRDKVSRGKKSDKGKETGSGGAPVSKSAKAVKPGKAVPVKEAAVPPPEINLSPTPDVPPRPVEEGKIVYLKMAELHPFHTFREHPYKVQDDRAAFGPVAPVLHYRRYHVGAGHRHFCVGVWQNVGNLFAHQFGPHPYGNDLPSGGGTDRAELSALPVCRGLPGVAHSGVCCDLCGADPGNCHGRRSHWGDMGHRGLYGFALLHAVQNRDDCAKYL